MADRRKQFIVCGGIFPANSEAMRLVRPTMNHQHFCHLCFGRSDGGVNSVGGWWSCNDAKCVRLSSTICRKHHERIDEAHRSWRDYRPRQPEQRMRIFFREG
jgi:hypothetical protein